MEPWYPVEKEKVTAGESATHPPHGRGESSRIMHCKVLKPTGVPKHPPNTPKTTQNHPTRGFGVVWDSFGVVLVGLLCVLGCFGTRGFQ